MNQGLLSILNAGNSSVGHALVAPGFHADPSFLSEESQDSRRLFDSKFLEHPHHNDLVPLERENTGSTAKIHFRVGGHRDMDGKLQPSSVFMVKPYYEDLSDDQFGHYPLSGWAEMAWHGIQHAADLSHTAMRIHSFPYEDSALLAIELEQGLQPVYTAMGVHASGPWDPAKGEGKVTFSSTAKDDASKLAALDFLLNNQDRNVTNLLMNVDHTGTAHGLLAIDNGRSMQYMEANNMKAPYRNEDSLFHYLDSTAYKPMLGKDSAAALKTISSWWKNNRTKIVGEFHRHLNGLGHAELATHIGESFHDRVEALDNVTGDFEKHGVGPYKTRIGGNFNGLNNSLMKRASVLTRPWHPQEDPLPLSIKPTEDRKALPCPSCGNDYSEEP